MSVLLDSITLLDCVTLVSESLRSLLYFGYLVISFLSYFFFFFLYFFFKAEVSAYLQIKFTDFFFNLANPNDLGIYK